MKSFFENSLLTAGFVFVFWCMITGGVQVKASWNGKEIFSVQVFGISDTEKKELKVLQERNTELHISSEECWVIFRTYADTSDLRRTIEDNYPKYPIDSVFKFNFTVKAVNYSVKCDPYLCGYF